LHIQHWYQAAEALKQAVEIDGDVVLARRMYARVLAKLRRFDEAVFQLVRAKRMAERDPDVARELGVAFYDKQLFDKAIVELERARTLAPSDAQICFALGLAHEAKRDYARAIAAYRAAVQLAPDFVDARRTLADALAAMGEMGDAVSELERALATNRTNMQIAMNLEVLRKGLKDLESSRLIGKTMAELERCTLIERAGLSRRDHGPGVCCHGGELLELWSECDERDQLQRLTLVIGEPERAAAERDVFAVMVVTSDGRQAPADYVTAATVTFLREALGCPLTRASALYVAALKATEPIRWGNAALGFSERELGGARRAGLSVEAR
jgi:tetratricopeptide (TPR) repeat protein